MGGDLAAFASTCLDRTSSGRRLEGSQRDFVCAAHRMCLEADAPEAWGVCYDVAEAKALKGGRYGIGSGRLSFPRWNEEGKLEWSRVFLDGSFVPAKKEAMRSG